MESFGYSPAHTQYVEELARLFGSNFGISTSPSTSPSVTPSFATQSTSFFSNSFVNPSSQPVHHDLWGTGFQLSRQRLNSSGSLTSLYSSDDSPNISPPISPSLNAVPFSWEATRNPWDDFATNGIDCDLDEIDKIMRRNNLDKNVRSSTLGQGRAAELLETKDPAMMMKNKLLLLIREAERNKLNKRKKPAKVCVFCKNNGECEAVYGCHQIKDDSGRITCPILYCYQCPKCGCTGENAHTLKYCPLSSDSYVDSKSIRTTARTAAGKRRFPAV